MSENVKIGANAKVLIDWHTQPSNYSREKEANIIAKFSSKYGIPKDNIKVNPKFVTVDSKGREVSLTNDIVTNIQDPKFHQKLFVTFAEENKIEDFDFDGIVEIDGQINSLINYDVYEKYKRYEVKWIRWSNFLSYGPDNFVDFTKLHGLVHLMGEPANQSGKSTFAYDLLHFLLFGKPSAEKADVLPKIFNIYNPEATEVSVEGCLCIDGQDYVIKRVLTRPALNRRSEKSKVTQKISYYKMVGDTMNELEDVDNLEGASGTETNKIIKEAIGNEKDFDLVISANADNLKSLISLKDTDRGRLLSRWIGLLPLEEKDKIAREKWNHEIQPGLLSNRYNREDLKQENETLRGTIEENNKLIESNEKLANEIAKNIESLTSAKEALIASKQQIDADLLNIDVQTVETKIKNIVEEGKIKRASLDSRESELKSIGEVTFSEEEYKKLSKDDKDAEATLAEYRTEIRNLTNTNKTLTSSEFCPTCGRKFENVDNSGKIKENEKKIADIKSLGIALSKTQKETQEKIAALEDVRKKYNRRNVLIVEVQALKVTIENLLHQHREQMEIKRKFESNRDAISKNNDIDLSIRNTAERIRVEDARRLAIIRETEDKKRENISCDERIKTNEGIISQIAEEEKKIRNWKIYLQMVGKDGIGKMVLRQALPVINVELARLLEGVCDFNVEVTIDDHNDVAFNLVRDGVVSSLSSGSGFEQTAAGIALRAVLGKISTMPKPSFIVLDEVLGGVAEENYDNIKMLYDRILPDYSFIFHISHLAAVRDWAKQTVVVKKENNLSRVVEAC